MKFYTFTLLLFMTFLSLLGNAQCPQGAVNSAVWGSPDDYQLGFTIDNNITDIDTVRVTQGVDTSVVMQYLLPKKQDITSPINTTATVTSVQIQGVSNLPIGINWTLDVDASNANNTYYPQSYRYGAVTMCGTTFSTPGVRTLTVSTLGCGTAVGQTQCQPVSFNLYIEVLPGSGGNSGFTFSPTVGCNDIDVDFEAIFVSQDPILNPIDFAWDFGDGTTGSGTNITGHNYNVPDVYPVQMDVLVNEFYISRVSLSNITSASDLTSGMDISGSYAGGVLSQIDNDDTPSWNTDITIQNLTLNSSFTDDDTFIFPASEDLGDYSYNLQVADLIDGNQVDYNANGYWVSIIINKRVASTIPFNDTVTLYSNSSAIATSSNGTLLCPGDSTTLSLDGSTYDFIQWFNDTTLILGANGTELTVLEEGDYSAKIFNTGSICEGFSNTINISINNITAASITQTASGLEVDNIDGYDVQWFSNGIPIPGDTNDILTDLSSGNPFTVSFTNAAGCSALSSDFMAIMAGTSTQTGTSLSTSDQITFEANGFSLCAGQEIGWAVSTQADGEITDMAGLQTAIDAGWVYPSTGLNTFDASCGNITFPPGDYYMTPFSSDAYDPDCVPNGQLCMEISAEDGVQLVTDELIFTFPDGSTKNLREVVPASFQSILPDIIDKELIDLLPSVIPGGSLCFYLSDLYSGDPNGDWTVSANNIGTGSLTLTIPDFEVGVYADSCSAITADEVSTIASVTGTIAANSSGQIDFSIAATSYTPPFPTLTPSCLLFGDATTFSSSCVSAIEDVIDVENINLFPNPNNGLFNLEFDLNESSNVTISIVDITGRKVLDRNYPNANNRFSETFDLKNNLQSGFYLLDIQIGNEHTQKKFIVK